MLSKDYTTELLGLKDVIVKNMEETEDFIKLSIELECKPRTCPYCGKHLLDKNAFFGFVKETFMLL